MSVGAPDVILTADLGAGSLRAAAIGLDGRTHAIARRALTIAEPSPGWAEADPEVWWQALGQTFAQVLAGVTPRAIAITAMTRSQVFLGRDGRALRPAITWRDTRAAAEAAECARWLPVSNPATAVNPFHPLARIAWLHHHEPDDVRRARCRAGAEGRAQPPPHRRHRRRRRDGRTVRRSRPVGGRAGLDRPEPRPPRPAAPMPWEAVGTVTATDAPFDALRGLPVFGGAMDTWAGAVGVGAVAPGLAYDVAGTSEAVGLITAASAHVDGLVTLPWTETAFQLGGPTQAGGDAARWAFDTLRLPGALSDAVERAGRIAPSRALPIFLPYLAGERAPVWRSDVTGTLAGLTRAHGAGEVMFAVLEGVAGAVEDIVRTAEGAGTRARAVHICGGGARSDAWCQIKADVLGLPVVRPREVETGLVGSAAAAAVGIGAFASLAEAVAAMNGPERTFEPRAAYADAFADRRTARASLKAFALGGAVGP